MMSRSDHLCGKTAFITGCNKGIGLQMIKLFARSGADIICCVRKETDSFTRIMLQLSEEHGVKVDAVYCDMSDENAIKAAIAPLLKARRQIDILINNAGVAAGSLLPMTSMSSLKEVFQINYFAPVLVTQLITKLMIRQKSGCIINIGSIAGLDGYAGYTSYGASKAAIMQFTRILACELAPYNIRVNAIAPGLIDTDMAAQMEKTAGEDMVNLSLMKRLGKPEEIANVALFLASNQSQFINGQVLRCDGGGRR